MIGIYLCDDDRAVRRRIQEALERKIFVEDWDMEVVCSADSPGPLLEALAERGPRRGVYFLDVELQDGDWDGFRLGQEIRRLDPHGTLVYITAYGELACRTFQYHLEAFDYIVKDPEGLEEAVCRCLEAVHARFQVERRDPEEVLTLREGDRVRHIPLKEILFFETAPAPHHVLLHTGWTSWAASASWKSGWGSASSGSTGPIWRRWTRSSPWTSRGDGFWWGDGPACCPGPGRLN